jgi:hypothetical protein
MLLEFYNSSELAVDFIDTKKIMDTFTTNNFPVFCLPEFIKQMPISLTFCFIYLIGVVIVVAVSFYLYQNRVVYTTRRKNRSSTDGYSYSEQNSDEQPNNAKILRRLLRSGQSTELQQISVLDGNKSRQIQ